MLDEFAKSEHDGIAEPAEYGPSLALVRVNSSTSLLTQGITLWQTISERMAWKTR
jgi:hypothetical protein